VRSRLRSRRLRARSGRLASVLRRGAGESRNARPAFLAPPTRTEADVAGSFRRLTTIIILALNLLLD
jgi:hypothetical protein